MQTTPRKKLLKKSCSANDLGKNFEKYLANKFGKRVAFSGSKWTVGGGDIKGSKDFRLYLGEAKATGNNSKSVSLKVIDKIRLEAMQEHRRWVLFLEIAGKKFALLDLDEFDYLVREGPDNE
jgi:hypothetical protein